MKKYRTSNWHRNEQIVALRQRGLTFGQVAKKLGINRCAVAGVLQQEKKHVQEEKDQGDVQLRP
jgi:lambda repressor-like predicted transcriptional regulator